MVQAPHFVALNTTVVVFGVVKVTWGGISQGGIDVSDISSKTMESKLAKDLYFIGEVLDVTGQLGGFNFQWAWSSAYVAAQSFR